jgi:hypothetical protein
VVVLGVALTASMATFFLSRHLRTPVSPQNTAEPADSSPALSTLDSASPPLPAWPENPVTYDCSEFAPEGLTPEARTSDDPASTLVRKARWYGASAVLCGGGLLVTRNDAAELERALTGSATQKLSPFARAFAQNAAMKVARCARATNAPDKAPTDARITALRAHAKQLVRRLALDTDSLTAIDASAGAALAPWLGSDADGTKNARASSTTFHAHATGNALAMRSLAPVRGADACYGKLVVVDAHGNAHALDVAAQVVFRKTTQRGITVCIAEPADPITKGAPALHPSALSVADLGPVRCDRCHQRGHRLSQDGPPTDPDRVLLDEVSAWYRSNQP